MVALRPILLIGLLVAGSGLLVHRFWTEEKPGSLPPPQQRDAAAPAPTAAPDPEAKRAEPEQESGVRP